MQRFNLHRPSVKKTPRLVAALFAPTVALSLQAEPTTQHVGFLSVPTSVPGNPPAAADEVSPRDDRFTWAGFVADVLGNRLTSTVDEPVAIEFFTSLFRAVSWGSTPSVEGSFTLFLPIDSAFSRRSGAEIDALVHDPEALRFLIGAHIVPGRVTQAELQRGGAFVALSGEQIAAESIETPSVNGAAVIGTTELEHGIVHFIDRLL